jgi:acyl-CoA synthetase (AMP-forming)/AMP-acid ligase II
METAMATPQGTDFGCARRQVTTWVSNETQTRFERAGHWTQETWFDLLLEAATMDPQALAVADERSELTREAVIRQARRLAAYLQAHGVRKGDVVTLVIPNCVEFVVAHAALGYLAAVVNPVLPRLDGKNLVHILRLTGSRFVLAASTDRGPSALQVAGEAAADVPSVLGVVDVRGDGPDSLRGILGHAWEDEQSLPSRSEVNAREWDTITTTSGTESLPKCVVHTHQTTMFGLRTYIGHILGLGEGDSVFMPSPICHASGLQWGLRAAIYARSPLILQDRWDPVAALDTLRRRRCTYTLAATPFIIDLLDSQRRSSQPPTDQLPLRYIASGGAQIPRRLVCEVRQTLGAEMMSVFGASETYIATATRPGDPDDMLETDGLPLPETETGVFDEFGTPLPFGVEGEIATRGPHVFIGYLGDPEISRQSFRDGWYRFGDLGRIDDNGCLHVTGRLKDIVIRGGENISVREVEEVLLSHPLVRQVAIVGYPDARLGERCCAVVLVVPGAEIGLPEINDYLLTAGVAKFKLPEKLRFVDSMPMTASGKIRKTELRSLAAASDPE